MGSTARTPEQKAKHAAYMREWYARPENREKKRQKDREYGAKNREKILERSKQYYEANKEVRKAYAREYGKKIHRRRRAEALAYLGGKCQECGNADQRVLQFAHRDPATKSSEVCSLGKSEARFWEEVKKCDLLCANCHIIRDLREEV